MRTLYVGVAAISFFVRQFCLPNPFECFGSAGNVYNWIAGLILAPVSYAIVGMVYDSGDFPALGSLLYLFVYIVLTAILWVLGQVCFAWWAVVGAVVLIVGTIVLLRKAGGGI